MLIKNHKDIEVHISSLSSTIASHVGPGMLAISYMGDARD
jgi:fatty acid-binding protein DegV